MAGAILVSGSLVEAQARVPAVRQLGRYRIFASLGHGGMGSIHLAVTEGFGDFRKLFVVKELHPQLAQNPCFVTMFNQEARLSALLSHTHVVQTYEAERCGDSYYIAMEFLDGRCLMDVMRRSRSSVPVPMNVRLRMICDALSGLHYAHECADYDGRPLLLVHRDVSPQNIFVTYEGQVKLLDFGVAKTAEDTPQTQPGLFKGKFGYAAPEQLAGQDVDRRADLFAMGVILWENVLGRRFARGQPTTESIDARICGLEPRVRMVEPELDSELAEICDRALQVNPDDRFPSAEAMRLALQRYLQTRGEWVEQSEVAEHMQQSFWVEREAMHELIAIGLQLVQDHKPLALAAPSVASNGGYLGVDSHRNVVPWREMEPSRGGVLDDRTFALAEYNLELSDITAPSGAANRTRAMPGDTETRALDWDVTGESAFRARPRRARWSNVAGWFSACAALCLVIAALVAPLSQRASPSARLPLALPPLIIEGAIDAAQSGVVSPVFEVNTSPASAESPPTWQRKASSPANASFVASSRARALARHAAVRTHPRLQRPARSAASGKPRPSKTLPDPTLAQGDSEAEDDGRRKLDETNPFR